jgi:hypothetical protein
VGPSNTESSKRFQRKTCDVNTRKGPIAAHALAVHICVSRPLNTWPRKPIICETPANISHAASESCVNQVVNGYKADAPMTGCDESHSTGSGVLSTSPLASLHIRGLKLCTEICKVTTAISREVHVERLRRSLFSINRTPSPTSSPNSIELGGKHTRAMQNTTLCLSGRLAEHAGLYSQSHKHDNARRDATAP